MLLGVVAIFAMLGFFCMITYFLIVNNVVLLVDLGGQLLLLRGLLLMKDRLDAVQVLLHRHVFLHWSVCHLVSPGPFVDGALNLSSVFAVIVLQSGK